jgi:hypothetical protein
LAEFVASLVQLFTTQLFEVCRAVNVFQQWTGRNMHTHEFNYKLAKIGNEDCLPLVWLASFG